MRSPSPGVRRPGLAPGPGWQRPSHEADFHRALRFNAKIPLVVKGQALLGARRVSSEAPHACGFIDEITKSQEEYAAALAVSQFLRGPNFDDRGKQPIPAVGREPAGEQFQPPPQLRRGQVIRARPHRDVVPKAVDVLSRSAGE